MNFFIPRTIFGALLLSALSPLSCFAEFAWENHYDFESITIPEDVDPQIGGMDLNAEGQLVACFHRGEVMIYDSPTKEWSLFASGLQEPLGILVEEEGTVLVVQRGELTRLHDEDQDGTADYYEAVSTDWGLSGNYHEFAFGPVKDSQGNIYVSLGTASNGAGVREEIRGEWNSTGGLAHEDFLSGGEHGSWSEKKKKAARMYARVPYRGCVLQIKPGSSKAEVYATGVRTPNGLYVDENDQLWVADNQGDWLGSSKLHRIEKGGFHGHPASLLWADNPPSVTPSKLPIKELEQRRIKSVGLFPQGECANSMTEILPFSSAFGPVSANENSKEQLIIGEMNNPWLIRYLPDVVNGKQQGAAGHLIHSDSLDKGNNRLLYSDDSKSIYLGKTHLQWPGSEGIKKVTYNGNPYLLVESIKLTPSGFEFTFNAPISGFDDLSQYKVESYRSAYHSKYGSPKANLVNERCAKVYVDGVVLKVELSEAPKADRIYDIKLPEAITSELSDLSSTRFWYTTHEVYGE